MAMTLPRRLIIGILVILILGIVGGTAVLLVQRFGGGDSGSQLPIEEVINPEGDDDEDGLTNAEEALWGTDPTNADTDGDGFTDGDEVNTNHNPTIPGPDDALPEGFQPQRNVTLLETAPLSTDEFFADNLDLSGDGRNLTDVYEQRISEAERSPDVLAQFIEEQPLITQLPTVNNQSFTVQQNSGPKTLATYLQTAGNTAALSNRTLLLQGLSDLYELDDPTAMQALSLEVKLYQNTLSELAVPPEAVELHKLLLGYTELVVATLDQIAGWNEDEVRATVAIRQLEANDRKYFPLIRQEVERLEGLSEGS